MRPVRKYLTTFRFPPTGQEVALTTIGVSPCAAKNVGWLLLSRHLREHTDLPQDGWQMIAHVDQHAGT